MSSHEITLLLSGYFLHFLTIFGRYKGAHTVSLASYLNQHHNQGVNNFFPFYQQGVLEEKRLHNGSVSRFHYSPLIN